MGGIPSARHRYSLAWLVYRMKWTLVVCRVEARFVRHCLSCCNTHSTLMMPHMCPDCGRSFKTRRGLSVHHYQCPKLQRQTKHQQREQHISWSADQHAEAENEKLESEDPWIDSRFRTNDGCSLVLTS